jgi:hypothetical protein
VSAKVERHAASRAGGWRQLWLVIMLVVSWQLFVLVLGISLVCQALDVDHQVV